MIAKRVHARKDGKSSIVQLGQYITDQKNSGEKVEYVAITNCSSDDPEWAMLEMQATQDANTRAKGDKTYHLVVSFPEGENPSHEQLRDIEAEVCRFVGLGDHQRLSAVHTDTDNLHMHIAINKIHPETLKMVEPYYDHYRLSEACKALEVKHNLLPDNHVLPGQAADRKAIPVDEMRAGGQMPLADWLKERVTLDKAQDWQALHKELAQMGVQLKPKGNGFVFQDTASGITVKASAVSREISGKKLIDRLGEFQAPSADISKIKPTEIYTPSPGFADGKAARAALWEEFSQERTARGQDKKQALAGVRGRQKGELDALRHKYKLKRHELKTGKLFKMKKAKKGHRSILKAEQIREAELIKAKYAEERQAVIGEHKQPDWRDWLQAKADQGSEDALEALRNTKERPAKNKNELSGKGEDHSLYQSYEYHINRDGKVTYGFGGDGFVDNGKKLTLGKEPSDQAIEAALKMAVQKYGGKLQMGGDANFQQRAQAIAKRLRLNISAAQGKQAPQSSNADIVGYITERNTKRLQVYDIMQHREYADSDAGKQLEFAGLRKLGNTRAVLLKDGDEVLVKEIKESQYKKLKNSRVGDSLKLDKQGRLSISQHQVKKGRTQ